MEARRNGKAPAWEQAIDLLAPSIALRRNWRHKPAMILRQIQDNR
jgi:hypothetical protein